MLIRPVIYTVCPARITCCIFGFCVLCHVETRVFDHGHKYFLEPAYVLPANFIVNDNYCYLEITVSCYDVDWILRAKAFDEFGRIIFGASQQMPKAPRLFNSQSWPCQTPRTQRCSALGDSTLKQTYNYEHSPTLFVSV